MFAATYLTSKLLQEFPWGSLLSKAHSFTCLDCLHTSLQLGVQVHANTGDPPLYNLILSLAGTGKWNMCSLNSPESAQSRATLLSPGLAAPAPICPESGMARVQLPLSPRLLVPESSKTLPCASERKSQQAHNQFQQLQKSWKVLFGPWNPVPMAPGCHTVELSKASPLCYSSGLEIFSHFLW